MLRTLKKYYSKIPARSNRPKRLIRMSRVVAYDLENDQVSSLVEFMKAASSGQFVLRGKSIEVTGLSNKRVKFLLRKFLHANRLSEYRVLDTTAALEIVRIKPEKGEKKRTKKSAPLKHPVPYGPPVPLAIRPELRVEWQGKPPPKKVHSRKTH
jgi:hypothetical protein